MYGHIINGSADIPQSIYDIHTKLLNTESKFIKWVKHTLLMWQVSIDRCTFLGEKFLGIFAIHDEFTWNLPQQLDNQRDVICSQIKQKKDGDYNLSIRTIKNGHLWSHQFMSVHDFRDFFLKVIMYLYIKEHIMAHLQLLFFEIWFLCTDSQRLLHYCIFKNVIKWFRAFY